jgi:SAM-dependent methyltransferase
VLPLFPKRRWHAALTIRELPKPAGRPRLLDVGFGDASFLSRMQAAGWEVAGLELDPNAVEAARSVGLEAAQGTLEDAAYEPGSFDAITLSHVIEHLHDPVAALATCSRLLRSGGVLWLATPNFDSPGHRRFRRDWFGLDPPRHLVLFNRDALERALARTGFERPTWLRSYRGELVVAGSQALAEGRDAATAWTPETWRLRNLARAFDVAAALRPEWGEELVVIARESRLGHRRPAEDPVDVARPSGQSAPAHDRLEADPQVPVGRRRDVPAGTDGSTR